MGAGRLHPERSAPLKGQYNPLSVKLGASLLAPKIADKHCLQRLKSGKPFSCRRGVRGAWGVARHERSAWDSH